MVKFYSKKTFTMEIIDQQKQLQNIKEMEKREFLSLNLHFLDLDML